MEPKKYKLIKEYPGSLKLGTIIQKQTEFSSNYMYKIGCNLFQSGVNSPKDYPEFWEEVVEKDFEILQMKNSNGNFYSLFENEELSRYERENHTIHSVKRLSDGEIFTVGDKVKRPFFKNPFKINHIHIAGDMVWLHSRPFVEGTCSHILDENTPLYEASKYKKPLFTTEDGVDIYDRETKVFELFTKTYYLNSKIPFYITNIGMNKNLDMLTLLFSTKEAAEEYILMNKPCLSINDFSLSYGGKALQGYEHFEQLKKLVKSKL